MSNLILTDVDGVLLNWELAFDDYMVRHGHRLQEATKHNYDISERYGICPKLALSLVYTFNESAAIGFLPPLANAIHYVKRLHAEHGYVFHCITSLGTDRFAVKLREMNLHRLFGDALIDEITCLPMGKPKKPYLERYRDSGLFWIEDHIENAEDGAELGLHSLLMSQPHNQSYRGAVPVVQNWRQVYDVIVGN